MKKLFIIGSVLAVMVVGGFVFVKSSNTNSSLSVVPTSVPADQQKTYTLADIQPHNGSSDCWMAIDGGVYNVTSYISIHPGGNEILNGCGKDASSLFHNRPDREPDHSAKAVALLANFKIGTLSGN